MAMVEASPTTTSNDACNDGQQQPADEDSDEDLCDISFPIIDNTATADLSPASDMGKNVGGGNSHADGSATPVTKVDEDAIIRCFDLSVNAHIEGSGDVKTFEPMSPKNIVSATSAKDQPEPEIEAANENDMKDEKKSSAGQPEQISETIHSKKGEWSPASLPLPSWATNIP